MSSRLPEKKGEGQIVGRRVKDVETELTAFNVQPVYSSETFMPFYLFFPALAAVVSEIRNRSITDAVQISALTLILLIITYVGQRKKLGVKVIWSKEGIGLSKYGKVVNWTLWPNIESIRLSESAAYMFDQNNNLLWKAPLPCSNKTLFGSSEFSAVGTHVPIGTEDTELIRAEGIFNRASRIRFVTISFFVSIACTLVWLSPIRQMPIYQYVNAIVILAGATGLLFAILFIFIKYQSEDYKQSAKLSAFNPKEDRSFMFEDDRPDRIEYLYKGPVSDEIKTFDLFVACIVIGSIALSMDAMLLMRNPGAFLMGLTLGILICAGVFYFYYASERSAKRIVSLLKRDSIYHLAIEKDKHYVLSEGKMLSVFNIEPCGFNFVSLNGSSSYHKVHTDEGVFYFQLQHMRPIYNVEANRNGGRS